MLRVPQVPSAALFTQPAVPSFWYVFGNTDLLKVCLFQAKVTPSCVAQAMFWFLISNDNITFRLQFSEKVHEEHLDYAAFRDEKVC